jgi:hypothetical protein
MQYGPDAVSFQIAQVGDDRKAEEFLAALDAHPKVGGLIDSTGNFEMESAQMKRMTGQDMDPSLWITKMLLGASKMASRGEFMDEANLRSAVDSSYDTKDERARR